MSDNDHMQQYNIKLSRICNWHIIRVKQNFNIDLELFLKGFNHNRTIN